MKDEEPGAQMQGCGARAWAEWSWDSNQLPAGWAAHPYLQRCHHVLLCLCHVVHQGCLWHCVCCHHLAAGVLRRVCGRFRDAATLQEFDVQHRERSPFQRSGLPCPCLTPQSHVHWSRKACYVIFVNCTQKKYLKLLFACLILKGKLIMLCWQYLPCGLILC